MIAVVPLESLPGLRPLEARKAGAKNPLPWDRNRDGLAHGTCSPRAPD